MFKKKPFIGVKIGVYKKKGRQNGGILKLKVDKYDLYGNEKYTNHVIWGDGFRLMYDKKTVFFVPTDSLAFVEVCE